MHQKMKGRIQTLSVFLIILFVILTGRLMQIQLISTESFSTKRINLIEKSVEQRTQSLVVEEGRGHFVDRHGKALTHDFYPTVILFPFLKKLDWPKEELASILHVPSYTLERVVESITTPVLLERNGQAIQLTEKQMQEITDLQFPGIISMVRSFRIDDKKAEHLIGLTSENEREFMNRYEDKIKVDYFSKKTPIGVTGLELAFDEFLLPEGSTKLLYHVDRNGGPLFGLDVRYSAPANPYYPLTIQTSIDREVQQIAEEIVEKAGIKKGGIVLLDIDTNEVLAMVSKPDINWNDPFGDNGTKNYMLERQFPGSVFKTVIAAAAIEKNLVKANRSFDCNLNLYGERGERQGALSFEESFAQSCNYTFASLGYELEQKMPGIIETYASRLGLIEPSGWKGNVFHLRDFKQIPQEETGIIWGDGQRSQKEIAQTSIGQKEVRVTPLAIANMMATIARGGKAMEVKVVKGIHYRTGSPLYEFPSHSLKVEGVSKYTTIKLQHLLREVVQNEKGTGHSFHKLPYAVAGKSGTAETGLRNSNGVPLVNRWFAGYFPFEKPKYALVVVDLETENSRKAMANAFYQMVENIFEKDKHNETLKEGKALLQ